MMIHACDFVWKIENFSIGPKQNRDFIVSPVFASKILDKTGWCIILTLEGEFLNVHIRRILFDKGPLCLDGGFHISAVDIDGVQRRSKRVQGVFLKGTMLTHERFVLKADVCAEKSPLLVADTMTLKGQIYKHSSTECQAEKIMIRSRLSMAENYFKLTVNPHDYCVERLLSSEVVKDGVMFICKWDFMERVPPFNLIFPSFIIKPQSETTSSIFVSAKITIWQRDEAFFRTQDVHRFQAGTTSAWTMGGWYDSLSDPKKFDDSLVMDLMCEITISDGAKEDVYDTKHGEVFENYRRAVVLQSKNDFLNDMISSHLCKLFPDMQIKSDEYNFAAHRCILSARSPLLRKLLLEAEEKWEESSKALNVFSVVCGGGTRTPRVQTGCGGTAANQTMHRVTVTKTKEAVVAVFTGVGKRIMEKLLAFMYSDYLPTINYETTLQLLQAADLYQIKGLKHWCENYLVNQITSVDRAWQILLVSHSLHSNVLRRAARLYMYENRECFMRYIAWRVFEDEEDKDFLRFYSKICDLSY